jgi:hypothetical protein
MITNQRSEIMTKFFTTRILTTGAFVAAATFSILSLGNSAQASASLSGCSGPSAQKVIDCCQKFTRISRPLWMIDSQSSCHEATVCASRGSGIVGAVSKVKRCYIKQVNLDNETHQRSGNGNRRGGKR